MKRLKVEPELRARVESLGEKPRSLWRYASLPTDHFVDPLNRHTDVLGKSHLSDVEWLKKLSLKYFACVLEGQARFHVGGQEMQAGAGDAVAMPANIPHAVEALGSDGLKMMLCLVKP